MVYLTGFTSVEMGGRGGGVAYKSYSQIGVSGWYGRYGRY